LLQFVTHFPPWQWYNSTFRESASQGLPVMQTALDQPSADGADRLCAHAADEKRELALLTQFMRHDSVASLANAIAKSLGGSVRGGELIAAANLGSSRGDS
jgi:hypothetical protein